MAKPSRIGNINISGLDLPVHFFFESRRNTRVSLGKKAVLVRLPHLIKGPLLKKEILWVKNWLEKTYYQKPEHFIRLARTQTPYIHGEDLTLFDRQIRLSVHYHVGLDKNTGTLVGDEISLQLVEGTARADAARIISRILAKKYKHHFEAKVHSFNTRFFQKDIQSVRLKYNSSNWGSCSTKSNINLSTRLLLTPEIVQDYIVVHELSHLVEMNHSDRFWKVVASVMPSYLEQEKWLKERGGLIDF